MSQNEQMIGDAMRYAISQLPGASEILKIKAENEKLTELQEDNERLQEELEGKEVLAKAYKEHKIEIMKLKKEVSRHRIALGNSDEENKKLKQKNEAVSKVNMFLSIQWKELKTNQNLAEMSGLGMDIGTDIAIVNIADEFVKLKEENEKLKEVKEENEKLKAENKKLKEDELTEESAIEYVYNHTDQYEDWIEGSTIYEELKEENKKLKEQNSVDKYDGDDWGWVYGKNIVDAEDEVGEWKDVVLCMAGGGDHWENYIMSPTMNYIENKDGKHPQRNKVLVQSSCGKYVSFQDEDYKCEEDECICEYENCVAE